MYYKLFYHGNHSIIWKQVEEIIFTSKIRAGTFFNKYIGNGYIMKIVEVKENEENLGRA